MIIMSEIQSFKHPLSLIYISRYRTSIGCTTCTVVSSVNFVIYHFNERLANSGQLTDVIVSY